MRMDTHDSPSMEDDHRGDLLWGLVVLRSFTVPELCAYARVDVSVAMRFLLACAAWVDPPASDHGSQRWRVRQEALAGLREAAAAAPAAGPGDAMTPASVEPPSAPTGEDRDVPRQEPDVDVDDCFVLAYKLAHEASSDEHRLGAASMYLARCESTLWSRQQWRVQRQRHELAQVRALRERIRALSGNEPAPTDVEDGQLRAALQDWSEPLPPLLLALEFRVPTVLQALSDGDLAHWVTGDLGLASPWYQAAGRAVALAHAQADRWPEVQKRVISHCVAVLSLASCAAALPSIGMIASTFEAGGLSLPLLGGLLLADAGRGPVIDDVPALSAADRRIVYMALCRLSLAGAQPTRVHGDAAAACELLMLRDPSDCFDLLAPGAMLRDMVDRRPWLDRALHPRTPASEIFDRNVALAIFVAAREPVARDALSTELATPDGLSLTHRLQARGAIRMGDDAHSQLLLPSESISAFLASCAPAADFEFDSLRLRLRLVEDSDENISMCMQLAKESWQRGMSSSRGGLFSQGVRTGELPWGLMGALGGADNHA